MHAHTITERTYAASTPLKMAKVDGNNKVQTMPCERSVQRHPSRQPESPRSQSPLSKTRHNKVIRESDNTVQRVSVGVVVLMYVVLTQTAVQTPLLQ